MEIILRTAGLYVFLIIIFRLAGKRALSEANTFDFVVLLIISEVTQQALVGKDYSVTTAMLAITTLVGLGLLLAAIKQKSRAAERLLDGGPVIIIHEGELLRDRMRKLHVDEDDILEAAHAQTGTPALDGIRYAVVEKDGQISIIPKKK